MEFPLTITIRVRPRLKEWLRRVARDSGRTVGEVVRILLEVQQAEWESRDVEKRLSAGKKET